MSGILGFPQRIYRETSHRLPAVCSVYRRRREAGLPFTCVRLCDPAAACTVRGAKGSWDFSKFLQCGFCGSYAASPSTLLRTRTSCISYVENTHVCAKAAMGFCALIGHSESEVQIKEQFFPASLCFQSIAESNQNPLEGLLAFALAIFL